MATLAGLAAGAAIGATGGAGAIVFGLTAAQIGGAIGATVGGIIDQQFVYPALFGTGKPLDGLRIDDMMVQTASEGSPMNYCLGPNNRVAGTLLWMDNIQSKKHRTGGKSGPTDYTYYVNVAIAICEGPVASVDKIWADGKLVWQKSNGSPGNNGSIVGTLTTTGTYVQGNKTLNVTMSNNPGDGAVLKAGDHIQLGFKPTTYAITSNVTIAQGASGSIAITPGLDDKILIPVIVNLVDWTDGFLSHLTVYKGTAVQTADPLMESILGVGNVPAYRNVAYTVLENFILAPFGNRLPNFTFQLAAQTTKTLASAISDLLLRAGLTAGDFDVTKVTGNLTGYTITGPQPVGKSLEPIMLAYNIDAQEKNGKLVFFNRASRDVINILEAELAAHEQSETLPSPFIINDRSSFDLPRAVTVEFVDKKNKNQRGTAREKRVDALTPTEDNVVLPVVLEHKDGRNIANRLLWDAWRENQDAEFSLPPSRLGVQEGDLLVVPFKSETYNIRVMDAKLGANFVVQIKGRIESYTTDDRDSISEDLPVSDFPVYTPPPITMHYMDLPSLSDAEVRSWGVYVAVCSQDPLAEWRGVDVFYDKNDTNIELGRKLVIAKEATMGVAVTQLGSTVLPVSMWDNFNTVDVSMWNGVLISSTDLDVLNGANKMIIESATAGKREVIAFVNATLIGTDAGHGGPVYRLSRLLRGLRNTVDGAAHAIGNICTLVNDAIHFAPLTAADYNTSINYRAVPAGALVAGYTSVASTFLAKTLIPWSPVDMAASPVAFQRVANATITFKWKRRTRAIDRLFTQSNDPNVLNPTVEAPEKYLFTVYDVTGLVALKTYVVDNASQITISATEFNVVLGLLTNVAINVSVQQVSPLVGKGQTGSFAA